MKNISMTDKKLMIELGLALLIKLIALLFIWQSFFSTPVETLNADTVANVLLSQAQQGEQP